MIIACETAVCLAMLLAGALEIAQSPPLNEIPLFLSWYDPALCEEGHAINCDSDPSVMAGGTAVTEAMYGYAAACIPEWFDKMLTIPGVGVRHCLDTGGAIKIAFREVYTATGFIHTWVIYIDLLAHHDAPPPMAYELVYGWGIE